MATHISNSLCSGLPLRILSTIGCLIILLLQASLLNYYLSLAKGALWWAWWICDTCVFCFFLAAFVISFRTIRDEEIDRERTRTTWEKPPGELPLGYLAWLIYACFLCVKIWLLFWDFAQHLSEKDFFGPNTLKVGIALSAFIYLLLVATHHDAKLGSERQSFIKSINTSVTMDLLDTVAILDLLFVQQQHVFFTFSMHRAILAIGSVNIILPVVPLLVLSKTRYGKTGTPKIMRVVHHIISLFLINLPLFIVRMIVWHVHNNNVSVFVIKNLLGIAVSVKTLIEECATASDNVDAGTVAEEMPMEAREHPSTKPDIERETDLAFSEAATLPIRHRGEPSQPQPRFV